MTFGYPASDMVFRSKVTGSQSAKTLKAVSWPVLVYTSVDCIQFYVFNAFVSVLFVFMYKDPLYAQVRRQVH